MLDFARCLLCLLLLTLLPSCSRAPHRFDNSIVTRNRALVSESLMEDHLAFFEDGKDIYLEGQVTEIAGPPKKAQVPSSVPALAPSSKIAPKSRSKSTARSTSRSTSKSVAKSTVKSSNKVVNKSVNNFASRPANNSSSQPIASSKDAASQNLSPENFLSSSYVGKHKEKGPLIVLDAGHGGKDTGAKSTKNDYEEKVLTLQTVNMVKTYLVKMGYQVSLTRKHDAYIELEERAEMANRMKAALFVSIHYNYCPNADAEGIEIFYYKDEKNPYTTRLIESRKLGETVLAGIVKHTGATDRGVKRANFAVIRETKMPAILIEGGFLSNAEERRKILDVPYRQYLAFGIASGIDRYLQQH